MNKPKCKQCDSVIDTEKGKLDIQEKKDMIIEQLCFQCVQYLYM